MVGGFSTHASSEDEASPVVGNVFSTGDINDHVEEVPQSAPINTVGENINHNSGLSAEACSGRRFDNLMDEDGFSRVLSKSQLRNWRKKLSKEKKRLQPIPYGLRSRATNSSCR